MCSVPGGLSLDSRPTFVPKTISDFLREVSVIGDVSEKVSRVNSFVDGLEEEMRKIDAFKGELPLCVLLLQDAILLLKEEPMQSASLNKVPVLEEFIPLKKNSGEDNGQIKRTKDSTDMKNWMSSVQLWKTEDDILSPDHTFETKQNLKLEYCKTNYKVNQDVNQDNFQAHKSRSTAGTFFLFKGYTSLSRKEKELPGPGFSLFTPGTKSQKEDPQSNVFRNDSGRSVSLSVPTMKSSLREVTLRLQQQTHRKQRRCWSPELHLRFVNALQQLGGLQAATPKQIRELMRVDDLTSDEVKSHLQKYRLHAKRVSTPTATLANQSVLRGLWMLQDPYGDTSKPTSSQSGSPQGPLQLTGNTGGTSTTGGDSMEDGEDAKSEGQS